MNFHVGIIMDGNRRFAEKNKMSPRFRGHLHGKKALEKIIIEWVSKMDSPKYLTLYAFSLQNLKKRKALERKFIFSLIQKGFREIISRKEISTNGVRITFAGEKKDCPEKMQKLMKLLEAKTRNHKKKYLTFCICYDGQEEIKNAFNSLVRKGKKKATISSIKENLYTKELPPLDLIIRTGGEKRISGFLLWDASYSEIIFRKQTWPEYTPRLFRKDINELSKRNRRFGK